MKNTTAYSILQKEKKQMIDILTDYWKEKIDDEIQTIILLGYSAKHRADKKEYSRLKVRVSLANSKFRNDLRGESMFNRVLLSESDEALKIIREDFFRTDILYKFFDFNIESLASQDNESLYDMDRKRLIEVLRVLLPYTTKEYTSKLRKVKKSEIGYIRYVLGCTDHKDSDIVKGILEGSN